MHIRPLRTRAGYKGHARLGSTAKRLGIIHFYLYRDNHNTSRSTLTTKSHAGLSKTLQKVVLRELLKRFQDKMYIKQFYQHFVLSIKIFKFTIT